MIGCGELLWQLLAPYSVAIARPYTHGERTPPQPLKPPRALGTSTPATPGEPARRPVAACQCLLLFSEARPERAGESLSRLLGRRGHPSRFRRRRSADRLWQGTLGTCTRPSNSHNVRQPKHHDHLQRDVRYSFANPALDQRAAPKGLERSVPPPA